MGVLHLCVRRPPVVDVQVFKDLQRLKRNLVYLAGQATDARTLCEFEKAFCSVKFSHEFDVDSLHSRFSLCEYTMLGQIAQWFFKHVAHMPESTFRFQKSKSRWPAAASNVAGAEES
jgi:hypothetical protein